MKVLFDCPLPFMLIHGGAQIQVEQTKAGLESIGVEVEYLRWWDNRQKGDIIHYFGAPSTDFQKLARQKGVPLINTVLLSATCNRSTFRLLTQALVTRMVLGIPFGESVKNQLVWRSYLNSDCIIVGLQAEKRVLELVYGVRDECVKVLPIGCEEPFLNASPSSRAGDYLICVGTISPQKRSLELAELAVDAQTPIVFVGKPYSESTPYWLRFNQFVADNSLIRYIPHLKSRFDLIKLLQNARGFVLYSTFENWCIAADEAAACRLPLLLPDLNWSRERFGPTVQYLKGNNRRKLVCDLRYFYDNCSRISPPAKPISWSEVGRLLRSIYEEVLSTSR
ncbi:MAG: hypothetical protein WCP06_02910 [Verrucomicrobiota bacterium]